MSKALFFSILILMDVGAVLSFYLIKDLTTVLIIWVIWVIVRTIFIRANKQYI